ncbi:DUF4062 domain-containing protein [Exiguobacterium artemiae]|uniref:DUF4062 domain-containing protein n=1 Tax=Exiguobacterium artemiae TaxID=340145 RepID=UPI00047C4D05|nr:DUF4062 domain-containing protein [Exiguobacterium sibiricum]
MEKKMQVYISSGFDALTEEHELVKQAILDANHFPSDLYYSEDTSPSVNIHMGLMTRLITDSDVFILILGEKFGPSFFMNTSQVNYEYLLARELNKPIFVFRISNDILRTKVDSGAFSLEEVYESHHRARFRGFKHRITSQNAVLNINHLEQLKTYVMRSLSEAEVHLGLNGWIRAEKHPAYQEVEKLQRELEKVKSKQQILIRETSRPAPESRQTKLGDFTYEEILYALTSRSINIDEDDAREFGLDKTHLTLLELLIEYHALLADGIPEVKTKPLDEMLKVHLVKVIQPLGLIEVTQQTIGEIPFVTKKLSANGFTLIGKIYSGAFKEINI